MRIVLDTNVLVRANIKVQGPARDLLLKIAYGDHVMITSPFLLREVERALAYPRLQKLWRLTLQDIQDHVQFPVKISELVHPIVEAPVVLKHPNDDPVVYTAIHGKADVICTLDRDFYEPEVVAFCRQRGVAVLDDVGLLQKLKRTGGLSALRVANRRHRWALVVVSRYRLGREKASSASKGILRENWASSRSVLSSWLELSCFASAGICANSSSKVAA
jgi:putative PIN family toxin of toxin-antitoxin system